MLNYLDCISTLLVTITTQTGKKCLETKITNTVFLQIVPAGTINLSSRDDAGTIQGWILFEGEYNYYNMHLCYLFVYLHMHK